MFYSVARAFSQVFLTFSKRSDGAAETGRRSEPRTPCRVTSMRPTAHAPPFVFDSSTVRVFGDNVRCVRGVMRVLLSSLRSCARCDCFRDGSVVNEPVSNPSAASREPAAGHPGRSHTVSLEPKTSRRLRGSQAYGLPTHSAVCTQSSCLETRLRVHKFPFSASDATAKMPTPPSTPTRVGRTLRASRRSGASYSGEASTRCSHPLARVHNSSAS